MLKKFLQFISDNQLFDIKNDTVLLGVSGGPDSVVMADLFFRAKIRFEICHVNFNLRGEDSVADMEFVKNLCETCPLPNGFISSSFIRSLSGFLLIEAKRLSKLSA